MALRSMLAHVVVLVVSGHAAAFNGAVGEAAPPDASELDGPGRIVEGEEVALGHGYSRRGEHISFKGVRIDLAGRETVEEFQRALGRPVTLAHDVDAASFVALSEEYSKDTDTVYYKWISPGRFWVVEIPNADPATFEVMDFSLAKDANRVWRTDVPIKGADAATARVVHPGWVWRDRRSVYYQFTRLEGADPASFRHLQQGFYRDARRVYWCTTRLEGADVETFRTFGEDVPYAADARHVWSAGTRLSNLDAASFRLLHNHVFADKDRAYVSTRALPILDADAATLRKVAELEAGCVRFRDAERDFLFDPYYGEVYTLHREAESVVVTKPVWFGDAGGPVRHAATVSATWADGALSMPQILMQPGFEKGSVPTWEIGKMQRMTDAIRDAVAASDTVPDPAGGVGEEALPERGDK